MDRVHHGDKFTLRDHPGYIYTAVELRFKRNETEVKLQFPSGNSFWVELGQLHEWYKKID